jgi:ParB family chromosome partitioning protein
MSPRGYLKMSKKKRFGIPESLAAAFKETIHAAENNAGAVRFEVVSLTRIEVDPDNPRELSITPEDVRAGRLKTATASFPKEEVEGLERLAGTIKNKGLINPVVVYKHGEKYRLVAGERRFLATLIAEKEDIQARILNEKPSPVDLKLLQWIENTEREDLTLKDRVGNIRAILKEYQQEYPSGEVNATLLKELVGFSLAQAASYLAVLNAPRDVAEHIQNGTLNNLEKAAIIAKLASPELRKQALEASHGGLSLKQLKTLVEAGKKAITPATSANGSQRGRAATRINMGATRKTQVVRKIITVMLSQPEYKPLSTKFADINWEEYSQVAKAFRSLIEFLEKEGDK